MRTLSTTIPASQARSNFYRILDEAAIKLRQFTVTLRGKNQAVIMSAEEFASWQETLEILSDKNLTQDIREGRKELKVGRGVSETRAKKILGW